jgi:hypothetical protein
VRYCVDAGDRLAEFDDEWRSFAVENGAPELASPSILGAPIASFCSDPTTNDIWQQLLARARSGVAPVVLIRCDGADLRRRIELAVAAHGDRVCITSTILSEEARPPLDLPATGAPRGAGVHLCCSWCKRWRLPSGAWVEVEEFVSALRPLETGTSASVSHAICPECRARFGRADA